MKRSAQHEYGLLCPKCEGWDHHVYDTRPDNGVTRRLRECNTCHTKFRTEERFVRIVHHMTYKKRTKAEPNEASKSAD